MTTSSLSHRGHHQRDQKQQCGSAVHLVRRFLHALRPRQPQGCARTHVSASRGTRTQSPKNQLSSLSGPACEGPLPEGASLPLLTQGPITRNLKRSLGTLVPLMPFFKGSSFPNDLLNQGTSHLFSLAEFCYYLFYGN